MRSVEEIQKDIELIKPLYEAYKKLKEVLDEEYQSVWEIPEEKVIKAKAEVNKLLNCKAL